MTHLIFFPYIMFQWKKIIYSKNSIFLLFYNSFLLHNPFCLAGGKQSNTSPVLGKGWPFVPWSSISAGCPGGCPPSLGVWGSDQQPLLLLQYPHSAQMWRFSQLQRCLRFQPPTAQHDYFFDVVFPPSRQQKGSQHPSAPESHRFPFLSLLSQPRWGYCKISQSTTSCGTLGKLLNSLSQFLHLQMRVYSTINITEYAIFAK